jgi:hypothetical protein
MIQYKDQETKRSSSNSKEVQRSSGHSLNQTIVLAMFNGLTESLSLLNLVCCRNNLHTGSWRQTSELCGPSGGNLGGAGGGGWGDHPTKGEFPPLCKDCRYFHPD